MRVLIFTFPFWGHTKQAAILANYLSRTGCEVVIDLKRDYFDTIHPDIQCIECLYGFDAQGTGDNQISTKDALMAFAEGVLLCTECYRQRANELLELAPDVVIFDSLAYWGKIFAEEHHIRHASLMTFQPFTERAFSEHYDEILRSYCSVYSSKKAFQRMMHMYEIYSSQRHNLPRAFRFSDMLCCTGEMNIVLFPRTMCRYAEYLDESFIFTGPLIEEDVPVSVVNKNIIYISAGTILQNAGFISKCIDALLPLRHEIWVGAGMASGILKSKYAKYPAVHIYEFAPQYEILKRAMVFITHGGMNSILEGLCSQTPLFVVPVVNDEWINARMVELNGYGIYHRGEPDTLSTEEIVESVDHLISSQIVKDNLQCVAEALRGERALNRAVVQIIGE